MEEPFGVPSQAGIISTTIMSPSKIDLVGIGHGTPSTITKFKTSCHT